MTLHVYVSYLPACFVDFERKVAELAKEGGHFCPICFCKDLVLMVLKE